MTDYELSTACAIAMGHEPYRAIPGGVIQHCSDTGIYIVYDFPPDSYSAYDPLIDDRQAMALVKKFKPGISWNEIGDDLHEWNVSLYRGIEVPSICAWNSNLNRAIVECVRCATAMTTLL